MSESELRKANEAFLQRVIAKRREAGCSARVTFADRPDFTIHCRSVAERYEFMERSHRMPGFVSVEALN